MKTEAVADRTEDGGKGRSRKSRPRGTKQRHPLHGFLVYVFFDLHGKCTLNDTVYICTKRVGTPLKQLPLLSTVTQA